MAERDKPPGISITVASDSDILEARQKGRALAERAGCRGTDLTLISTAVSEMARIVASRVPPGRIDIDVTHERGKRGILLVVHLSTTEQSSRLELPYMRRLLRVIEQMDDMEVSRSADERTLTLKKWCRVSMPWAR